MSNIASSGWIVDRELGTIRRVYPLAVEIRLRTE
jgi:hypothetical protein